MIPRTLELEAFDYHLPQSRIAQTPTRPRDHSRLFVYNRTTGRSKHDRFFNLPSYLNGQDILVFNNTKVFPARLIGSKDTGGKLEIFLLKPVKNNTWEVLIGGHRKHEGSCITFGNRLSCHLVKDIGGGAWQVRFNLTGKKFWHEVYRLGQTPLPPYIKKQTNLKEYQTVYAQKTGSVAAPTAGFHFTKKLLRQLRKQGIQTAYVTLHVGLGTFAPVKTQDITKHRLHAEWVEVDTTTATRLNRAKKNGKRIVAVGTTTVRTLEALADKKGHIRPAKKWVNIFIYPSYRFRFVDVMITNFHLPKSSLLMLVEAWLRQVKGPDKQEKVLFKGLYAAAIKKKYRFYSFGDGMLIK